MAYIYGLCPYCNATTSIDYSQKQIRCDSCNAFLIAKDATLYYEQSLDKDISYINLKGRVLKKFVGNAERVSIPSSVKAIGPLAFLGCDNLREVIIPEGVLVIAFDAFKNCRNLEKVRIPGSVLCIEENAFENCISLKRVSIQYGVKKINNCAFYKCDNLQSITIPESVDALGWQIFSETNDLLTVYTTKKWAGVLQDYCQFNINIEYTEDERWWKYISKEVDREIIFKYGAKVLARIPDDEPEEEPIQRGYFDYSQDSKVFVAYESNKYQGMAERDKEINSGESSDSDDDEYYYSLEHYDEYFHEDDEDNNENEDDYYEYTGDPSDPFNENVGHIWSDCYDESDPYYWGDEYNPTYYGQDDRIDYDYDPYDPDEYYY